MQMFIVIVITAYRLLTVWARHLRTRFSEDLVAWMRPEQNQRRTDAKA